MNLTCKILLICDDEEASKQLKREYLDEVGCMIIVASQKEDIMRSLQEGGFGVVLMRLKSYQEDLAGLVRQIKKSDPDTIIIIIGSNVSAATVEELYTAGVYDFIDEPINRDKLIFLIQKGAQLHSLMQTSKKLTQGLKERNISLEKQNIHLAKRIEDSTKNLTRLYEDLRSTYMRTIKSLAQAIEARDHYTHSHSETVAKIAVAIAQEMKLTVKEIETIREACELHDLGKIGIEDSILLKPSGLNAQEWEQVKRHPITGAQILEPLTFLSEVIDLVRQHHEHFDGSGYPEGRKGPDILLGARIIHLADAYEAMRSARSYRKIPLTKEEAVAEVKKNTGTQFDPGVVEAFLRIVGKL